MANKKLKVGGAGDLKLPTKKVNLVKRTDQIMTKSGLMPKLVGEVV